MAGNEPEGQVGIPEMAVTGVRRAAGLLAREHPAVAAQKLKEGVTAAHKVAAKLLRQQHVQLYAAQTGVHAAVIVGVGEKELPALALRIGTGRLRVIPLALLVKQSAKSLNAFTRILLA